jgi:hypothetical protein
MRDFVDNSAREGQADDDIPVEPFRLNPTTASKPSTFEAVFLLGGLQYRYGFTVNSKRVLGEWLYYVPTIREVELFTRDEEGIHVGSAFREGRNLKELTRDNALFLSVSAQFNGKIATEVRRWFTRTCHTITATQDHGYLPFTMNCIEEGNHREQIEELVRRLDLDITDLSVVEVPIPQKMSRIHDALSRLEKLDINGNEKSSIKINAVSSSVILKELRARHLIRDDNGSILGTADFPINKMESEGTKKLIALAGPIIDTLADGDVLFIDEIDARLRKMLSSSVQPMTPICLIDDTIAVIKSVLRRRTGTLRQDYSLSPTLSWKSA